MRLTQEWRKRVKTENIRLNRPGLPKVTIKDLIGRGAAQMSFASAAVWLALGFSAVNDDETNTSRFSGFLGDREAVETAFMVFASANHRAEARC